MSECGICGESITPDYFGVGYVEEVGEFVRDGQHVIAHASCGLEREWDLA